MLTSRSPRVKAARRLTRRTSRWEARTFLAEGPQAVREALASPGCVVEVFATYDATRRHALLAESAAAQGLAWHLVDETAVAALSDTKAPQGVTAVCRFVDVPLGAATNSSARLVVICADVRDPGNAGTVIRCADAAGADGVILAGHAVDPYNSKAVRASAGSLFHLPLAMGSTLEQAVGIVRAAGLTVLAADGAGARTLDDLADSGELAEPTAWVFGNEAWGLPPEAAALADSVVRLPIYGRAESLNLATAAAVCLYASARAQQRSTTA